jgi:hypothetical protein
VGYSSYYRITFANQFGNHFIKVSNRCTVCDML